MKRATVVVCLLVAACGSEPAISRGSAARQNSAGGGSGNGDATGGQSGSFGDGSESPPAAPQANEVWAHSADTLYKLDPITKSVTIVAAFSGCVGPVIDIALDARSNLYGTTYAPTDDPNASGGLWSIDRTTAVCTKIADGRYPNSLSFVPAGTVDPNVEALVGYDDDNYYVRIDTTSGAITRIGGLGNVGFGSSGDIVSVKGGASYLTVRGGSCSDCLVEVNPSNGSVVKNWGSVNHPDVFGLAFWAGNLYGFDDAGALFEIAFDNGAMTTRDIPIPSKPATLKFLGAGSTTSAPLTRPR